MVRNGFAAERVWCDLGPGTVRVMVVSVRDDVVVFKRPLRTGHGHREVSVPRGRFLETFRSAGEVATAAEFDVLPLPDFADLDEEHDGFPF